MPVSQKYMFPLYIFVLLCILEISGKEVCFENLDCFSQDTPWVTARRPFPEPQDPNKIDVSLKFFTRSETKGEMVKVFPKISFEDSGKKYDGGKRTLFIIHGFASSSDSKWILELKEAYLKVVDANVFVVDWSKGSNGLNYFQAASNTRVVGRILGRFCTYLIKERNNKASNMHIIGDGLGAHLSAYISQEVKNTSSTEQIDRITGLDPSQPGFQSENKKVRLSYEYADFVEVVHSDAKLFIPFFGFGYLSNIGMIDIYLNEGSNQPGCYDTIPIKDLKSLDQLKDIPVDVIAIGVSCSHNRAREVYTSSISNTCFVGHRTLKIYPTITADTAECKNETRNCLTMGLDLPKQGRQGSFQVFTSNTMPFCCGKYDPVTKCSNNKIILPPTIAAPTIAAAVPTVAAAVPTVAAAVPTVAKPTVVAPAAPPKGPSVGK